MVYRVFCIKVRIYSAYITYGIKTLKNRRLFGLEINHHRYYAIDRLNNTTILVDYDLILVVVVN